MKNIVFQDDMTMRKYYEFSQELRDLEFKWVGIRTVDNGEAWNDSGYNPIIGFNPDYSDEPFSPMRPNLQKYPMFYLHDMFDNNKEVNPDNLNFMANSYEQHFKSRLNYLKDRKEFTDIFGHNKEFYEYASAYVEENGVNTYGVLVYATAEEFLKCLEKIPYESIIINDILIAKPEIYWD